MAFPTVQATAVSGVASSGSPAVVSLPAGIAAGDLLIIQMGFRANSVSTTTPSGWTALFQDVIASATESGAAFYKIASGSEGASVSVTLDAAHGWEATAWRITGHDLATAPVVGTRASATSATHTPAALSPAWGALDTLWIACAQNGLAGAEVAPTYPANYGSNNLYPGVMTAANSVHVAAASRQNNTATETPAGFVYSGSSSGIAYLIAVKPATITTISAVLTATFANATVVGTAKATIKAALTNTFANATLAATGTLKVQAALAKTFANATLSSTAALKIKAALASTFADATLVGRAVSPVKLAASMALNITLGAALRRIAALSATMSADVRLHGMLSKAIPFSVLSPFVVSVGFNIDKLYLGTFWRDDTDPAQSWDQVPDGTDIWINNSDPDQEWNNG